ncbi:MAG TPA: ABC transporter substrate-binding protein [Thermoleophilaceae bacterium]
MTATYPARWLASLALLVLAATGAGCGGGDDPSPPRDGALTIYSSLPRQGILARAAGAVAAGQRLALADARGRAGGRAVRLVELDSAGGEDGPWDPDAIEENARRAGEDQSAIAYLGELDLGGSAVSVPVTNAEGLLQVTPGDGLPSLTRTAPSGGEPPVRYYPEGRRNFIRVVPHAGLQAQALVAWARERGARSIAIVRDESVFGRELAEWLLDLAERARLPAETERISAEIDDHEAVARDVAERRPGAVLLTALAGRDTDLTVAALRRVLPAAPLLATSAVAPDPPDGVDFLDPRLPAREYGAAAGRILRRLERAAGAPVGPAALYGYEAMRLVLDAVDRAGARPGDRAAVLRAAAGPRPVDDVLGRYFLAPDGDVSTSAFGAYRSERGRVRALGVRSAEAGGTRPPP